MYACTLLLSLTAAVCSCAFSSLGVATLTHLLCPPHQHDPSENYPVNSKSSEYKAAMATISAAKSAHEKTLKYVTNQMALGTNKDYGLCGAPHSQKQYPQYPNCTMDPGNWHPFGQGVSRYSE